MADKPDVAVGPEVAELTVCGRAVEIPVAGSAFPGGHRPFDGLFRVAQFPASAAVAVAPLVCTDVAVIVEVEEPEELAEAMEEAEFCRCTVLRGPEVNILLTSSGFIAPKPLPLEVHPMRLLGWKDRGGATAVIGSRCVGEGCTRRGEVLLHFVSLPRLCCLWFTLAIPHSLPRVIMFPIPMQCAIFLRVYSLWLPISNAVCRVNTGRAAVVCSCYDGCKTAVESPNIVYEQILSNMSSLLLQQVCRSSLRPVEQRAVVVRAERRYVSGSGRRHGRLGGNNDARTPNGCQPTSSTTRSECLAVSRGVWYASSRVAVVAVWLFLSCSPEPTSPSARSWQ